MTCSDGDRLHRVQEGKLAKGIRDLEDKMSAFPCVSNCLFTSLSPAPLPPFLDRNLLLDRSDQESYQASQQDEITGLMADAQQTQEDIGSMDAVIENAKKELEQCGAATQLLVGHCLCRVCSHCIRG